MAYTYDDNGNILTISDGTYTTSYVYDSQNQLIRENNQKASKTWTWEYDAAGNIRNRKEYAYTTGTLGSPTDTVNYTYGDDQNWGDLLTGCDGKTITYDEIGNPLSDGTWTYTWWHGRKLASMSDGTTTWSFSYNADGMRTKRTDGTTTYNYVYNGSSLTQMTVGTDSLSFAYDAVGTPMAVNYNGTTYYYVTNLQGDVIAILNSSGTAVVAYSYDAWGNILSTTGTMATTLGNTNPLRYRGYVYDQEYDLYYLQSRYYDPEIGRFLNADAFASTGQGFVGNNMFAYCGNNPVIFKDISGYFLCTAIGAAVGAAFGALSAVIQGKTGDDFKASVLAGATSGAISGAAADVLLITGGTAGVVAGVMAGAGAIGAIAGNAIEAKVTGESKNLKQTAVDVFFDASFGALFGYMGGPISSSLSSVTKKSIARIVRTIIKKETKEIGYSIVEETLENAIDSIARFTINVIYKSFEKYF